MKKNEKLPGNRKKDTTRNAKKNNRVRRGKPKPRPKDIFDMDPQPKPKKKQKKANTSGFDDIISAEYLQWLEYTAMQSGYDPIEARAYFDRIGDDSDFRREAAEWFGDVKHTFGYDVAWFDFQRRGC